MNNNLISASTDNYKFIKLTKDNLHKLDLMSELRILPDHDYTGLIMLNDLNKVIGYGFIDDGYINNIYITPGYRNKGFGTLLVSEIMARFKGNRLCVGKNKQDLINFYKTLGFKPYAEDTLFYYMNTTKDDSYVDHPVKMETEKEEELEENNDEKYESLSETLLEDKRTALISKSQTVGGYKNTKYGKNRFERKKYSKLAQTVQQYNKIDMNEFFKQDTLIVTIPVMGETDNYTVTIKMEGVCSELAKSIKSNNNKLEFKNVIQALTKTFNTADIYTKCTCQDFCLHPDTQIKLLNGKTLSVEDLEEEFKNSKTPLYLYSVDEKGNFKPGKITNVWVRNYTEHMLKITLDNGKSIITTGEHPYMLRNGQYLPASELSIGQSLAALNRTPEEKADHAKKIRETKIYKVNHKIVAIENIEYDTLQPVYDIEVENYHNFYVDAGVILHNCYRFAHWNIVNNVSVDDTAHDPGPGKGIANPNDDKGRGCKHILLTLSNGDWLMKVASVINNYIHYAEEHLQKAFMKAIFPRLYGMPAEDAKEQNIIPEDINLETETNIIELINDWAKNRGKFVKGSNVNPVQADKLSKEQQAKKDAEEKTEEKENAEKS